MSNIKVTINGKCEFNGDLGEWKATPPDFVKDVIKPGAHPELHMLGVMLAVTDAVMRDYSTSIEAKSWDDGWTMTVKRKGNK